MALMYRALAAMAALKSAWYTAEPRGEFSIPVADTGTAYRPLGRLKVRSIQAKCLCRTGMTSLMRFLLPVLW